MYQVSYNYQQRTNADSRHIQAKIEVSAQTDLTEDDIIEFEVKESVCDGSLSIGTANSQVLELTCRSTSHTFYSAHLKPYIGLDDEWCPLGVFIVADVECTDGEYKITAYDRMAYLDEEYIPTVYFPSSCANIIDDISTIAGFTVESGIVYPSGNFITGIPENGTYRQMIGYVAGLMGKNARFNRDGELTFGWFKELIDIYGDVDDDHYVTPLDVDIIESDLIGSTTVPEYEAILGRLIVGSARMGAEIKEKSFVADVNEDGMVDSDDVDEIQAYIDGTPYPDTKVGQISAYKEEIPPSRYYLNELTDVGTFTFTALISGTQDNPIESGSGRAISFDNPFMTQARLNTLRSELMPFTYDAGQVTFIGNPSYEVGDIVRINGRDFPIMNQSMVYNGGLKATIESYGLTEEKQLATNSIPTLIESIREVSAIEQKVAEITADLNNAQGLYGGTYKELYGSDLDPSALSGLPIGWRVINNNDPLKWWQMTYNGLAFTSNGGASYKVGITNEGNIIANDIAANSVLSNKVTAQNLEITGGKIDITTSSGDYDTIKLAYSTELMQLSAGYIDFTAGTSASSLTAGRFVIEKAALQTIIEGGIISCSTLNATSIKENGHSLAKLDTNNTFTGTANYFTGGVQVTGNIGAGEEISAGHFAGALGTSSAPQRVYLNPVSISPSNWTDAGYSTNTGGLGYQSSSRKYKKYIGEVKEERLKPERLYDLPVVQYKYRAGSIEDGVPDDFQIGFIAEDMDEIYPFACYYKDGDPEAWTGKNLIPAMLKLIQEQHAEIESLKEEINGLTKQN